MSRDVKWTHRPNDSVRGIEGTEALGHVAETPSSFLRQKALAVHGAMLSVLEGTGKVAYHTLSTTPANLL